jgi:hypothetical protein
MVESNGKKPEANTSYRFLKSLQKLGSTSTLARLLA